MTPEQFVRDLRTVDPALRRFATHLVPGRADEALRRAYSTAIAGAMPVLEGERPSRRMFWEVRASALALRTTSLASASAGNGLATAFHALPVNERAALLLVGVEGVGVADAASVLGVPPERVVDLSDSAAASLREAVPALGSADDATLVAQVRDLPIAPAAPPFWDAVDREVAASLPAPAEPERRTSPWLWAGVAAVAFVAIVAVALAVSQGDDDDETVAIDTSTSLLPETTTTVPLTSTTALPETTTTPPDATTSTTAGTTTTAAPSTTTETTVPPDTGPVDRGDVPFDDGAATISGTLEGRAEQWRLAVGDGQALVVPAPVDGIDLQVLDGGGAAVAPGGTGGRLQVFDAPGDRLVQVAGGEGIDYAVGLGLSGGDTAWLSIAPEPGSALAAADLDGLTTDECTAVDDSLDATLTDADDSDQRLVVAVTGGSGTATWTGPVEAAGSVTTITPVAAGTIVDGVIDTGPDDLIGRSFGLVVLGCTAG